MGFFWPDCHLEIGRGKFSLLEHTKPDRQILKLVLDCCSVGGSLKTVKEVAHTVENKYMSLLWLTETHFPQNFSSFTLSNY